MAQQNVVSMSALLRNCIPLSSINPGKQTHAQILALGFLPHVTLQTDLLLMYSKCNHLDDARRIFDEMPERNMHSWNILISSYCQSSLFNESISVFNGFLNAGLRPDHFTFPSLFKACAGMRDLYLGKKFHNWVIRLGFEEYVIVKSSILDLYAKCGCLDGAHRLFETMPRRDVVVWNAMILGLGRAGFSLEALGAFKKMQFDGVNMDSRTIPSVLNACGREGDLMKGKEVHGQVVKNLAFSCDAVIGNSLMDMYAKCGRLDDLSRVFANMRGRNLVSWTTLISCYGVHGKGKESLILFEEMIAKGIKPNCVTFTAILASCSHSGLVDEGHRIFESMRLEYGVEPSVEHYACMVDLLGRIGRLQEALELIKGMQQEPSASIWGALLGACQTHKNVDLGEIAAFKLFELETANSSNYIALCSIYDAVGKWDGVSKMRKRMRELGLVKTPGCSWINMKGRVHRFYQGDISHPMKDKIYEILNLLSKMVVPEGCG